MRTKQLQCFLTAVLVLVLFSFGAQGKGRPFITRWKGEAGKVLQIPIKGENYKLVIKKADGTVLKTETSLIIADYSSYQYTPSQDGELLIEAGPEGVTAIDFYIYYKSAEALLRVEQFGTVQWQTMVNAFIGCENMQFAANIDAPDLSRVTDMGGMFSGCTSFNQPLNNWDVSKVTSMRSMFQGCTSFNQPLNNWNVSQVTRMWGMFQGCTSFNQSLNSWDVSMVTSMGSMLQGCTSFNQSLNSWNVSKVTDMSSMLQGCTFFNQSLNSWDVSMVTDMSSMLQGCTFFNQPLNNWDVSKVWSMKDMFCGCSSFNQELGMWKLEKCQYLGLNSCGMSAENYGKSLEGWAAQTNIKSGLELNAAGLKLKYSTESKKAREKLINSKKWKIIGDELVIIRVTGVILSQTELPLLKGATETLIATVVPSDATNKRVTWSSTNTAVATVENGTVTAVSAGNATITVTTEDGNHTARCEVVVVTDPVPVTGVTLSQTKLPLLRGATAKLTATVSPTGATNRKVTWSSNNTTVATVENGTVTAVSAGNAIITVTTEDGNHTARCEVVVTDPIPVSGVTLSQTKLPLLRGATAKLTATVSPADATNKKVRWSSNNTAVAIVENGTIAAVSVGNVTITVTTEDGNHTARCEVVVTDPVPAASVTLSQTELILRKGATAKLTATVLPTDATNKKVRWNSNNTAVAIVESGTVAALSAGNATITVTTEDGNYTARCEVVVTDPIPVSGVSLSQTELSLVKGATATLRATVVPSDATNQKVTWHSTNTAVVIVENGIVTAVSAGNATIMLTTEDGNHTATCEVTVTVPVTGVTLSQTELSLVKGATATLSATVVPADATNKKVTWRSNNTSIATVENGTVTAVSAGNATITVTTEDGNHTARCEVVVTAPVPAASVTLSQTELPLVKGATATLTATVVPSDATNQKVRWSSNNTSVATVENGTVTAVSGGNATITVTTEDGNHTATCEVTVAVSATGVTLSQTELPLAKGATATLTATVAPSDATNKKVTWSSNNTSIATVENGIVTAVSGGNATITVTTEDGNHTATCSVAVEATSAVEDVVFASVVVSPNPFGEQLCITYGDLRGQYVLYNAQGVVVASGGVEDGETRINTVSFTAGVYLLRLTAENGATKNYTVVKD